MIMKKYLLLEYYCYNFNQNLSFNQNLEQQTINCYNQIDDSLYTVDSQYIVFQKDKNKFKNIIRVRLRNFAINSYNDNFFLFFEDLILKVILIKKLLIKPYKISLDYQLESNEASFLHWCNSTVLANFESKVIRHFNSRFVYSFESGVKHCLKMLQQKKRLKQKEYYFEFNCDDSCYQITIIFNKIII